MAGRERDPDNSSAVPGSEPALLVVALPAHRLLLLALGHPAFPGQAHDVGVAAEDRAMLHGGEHPCGSLRPPWMKKLPGGEIGVPSGSGGGGGGGVGTVTSAAPPLRLQVRCRM